MNLYKMILVDDEEDVRQSIEKKVDWNALGFEIVGSAGNGEEALELTEKMHVDVVMTDIKMPFMDGLTLCAKVKENYKNTKVVLYSGFDEFELAREAVHLEAEEYLLKPIGAKDLDKVFTKIKENLDREIDERTNINHLNEYYEKSLPMMKEQLLTGMLEGKLEEEQAKTMIETYKMDFGAPFYCVALLSGEITKEDALFQTKQLKLLSLENLTKEYLQEKIKCHISMFLNKVAIIAQLQQEEDISDFIYHVDQICKMGNHMLEIKVNAGVGQVYSGIGQIGVSHEEAKTALDYRILGDESGQTIYINDVEPKSKEMVYMELAGISGLIKELKFGTKEEIEQSIDDFIEELTSGSGTTMSQYQLVIMEMVTEILKLLRNYQLDMTEVFGAKFSPYQELEGIQSVGEFSSWLKEKSFKVWEMIRKRRTRSTNIITEKAKNYIEEHYVESSLSVEDLCNYLNVSATYFSLLFKKEVGMSFVSYLTKVRLEHAVELLNNTEDKSYMIAEKVGYTEANYFSYVFKKEYGVSPSKYRTSKEG